MYYKEGFRLVIETFLSWQNEKRSGQISDLSLKMQQIENLNTKFIF